VELHRIAACEGLRYTASMTQHNPAFIEEMKKWLEADKEHLQQELAHKGFPEYGRNDEDNATEIADYESTLAAQNVLQERLKNVLAALQRIEDGTYGVTASGALIPESRLKANPAATSKVE
jgi:DnaK suppressor protein